LRTGKLLKKAQRHKPHARYNAPFGSHAGILLLTDCAEATQIDRLLTDRKATRAFYSPAASRKIGKFSGVMQL